MMMRQPIRELPPHIASLIAAGEVIRRPEDIIRELIDNSIDAGATQIEINVTQGGLEKIQIKDNGIGIPQNELALALMHHATSKIRHIDDIEVLKTLGFRGEALASITAVARIELSSRVAEHKHGFTIVSKPDQKILAPKPVAHPVGTTITITELFHQVPARRRFLRTATTEFARIHSWVKYLSLSHAEVGFSLTHNKRSILKCIPTQNKEDAQRSRLATLYSPDFVKSAIFLQREEATLSLTGWISPPDFSRSQSDWQCFYINGRLIKDKSLSHAVKKAYQDVLYRDRQPATVLFLTVDPKEVDVNVHPTKAEVRFHQPQLIYHFVYNTIKTALTKNKGWISNVLNPNTPLETPNDLKEDIYKKPSVAEPFVYANDLPKQATLPHKSDLETQNNFPSAVNYSFKPLSLANKIQEVATQAALEKAPSVTEPLGYALAQLHSTYILAQNDKGLIIVDAHAAHERILYEKLKTSFEKEKPQVQQLLIPLTLSVTATETELAKTHDELFKKMGFDYMAPKEDRLIITAIPHVLSNIPSEVLIRDLLSDLKEHGTSIKLEEKRNQLLSTIACRSATHANRTMSLYEMNQLLRAMETTPHSGQCNHGRPTWRQITLNELDGWFLRGR